MIFRAKANASFFIWIILLAVLSIVYLVSNIFSVLVARTVFIISLTIVLFAGLYLPLLVKRTYCKISGNSIVSKTGVFFAHSTSLSINSIIYLSIYKTPFSRITGLNFIVINTFGGKSVLFFLPEDSCKQIKELLTND